MKGLQIMTRQLDREVISITLKGFVDGYTCSEVERAINWLFDRHIYSFIVDLSEVGRITSVGIGVLIGAWGVAKENRGNIVIFRPSPNVREVFDLLGLTHLFTITNEPAATRASLNNLVKPA